METWSKEIVSYTSVAFYENCHRPPCIASGLFNNEKDLLGEQIEGADCSFIPITKIPILIVKQNKKPRSELLKRAKRNRLKYMLFTREGQSTTSYQEYVERVKGKKLDEIEVIGIGVLGEEETVNKFAGDCLC